MHTAKVVYYIVCCVIFYCKDSARVCYRITCRHFSPIHYNYASYMCRVGFILNYPCHSNVYHTLRFQESPSAFVCVCMFFFYSARTITHIIQHLFVFCSEKFDPFSYRAWTCNAQIDEWNAYVHIQFHLLDVYKYMYEMAYTIFDSPTRHFHSGWFAVSWRFHRRLKTFVLHFLQWMCL